MKKTYGNWNVISRSFKRGSHFYYLCECICGKQDHICGTNLRQGKSISCGCSKRLDEKVVSYNSVESRYKSSAKRRNIKYSLTREQFIELISKSCYYCGFEGRMYNYYFNKDKTKCLGYSSAPDWIDKQWIKYNGIDRKDNNIGYEFDNCLPCCKECNFGKHDLSFDKFKEYITRLINFNKG